MKGWILLVLALSLGFSNGRAQELLTAPRTTLGTQDSQFTMNGKPVFLYGVSYYGALGAAKEVIQRDLADFKRHGFNWLRVWATWAAFGNDVSAVDPDGKPRAAHLEKLQWLVGECDRQGLVVDVTLSRGNGVSGPPKLQSLEAHRRAVETIVTALKPRRNWYLDLSNERNIQDQRFTSFQELGQLRERARALDPALLVTASQGGDISSEELSEYLFTARVDMLTPHRPRDANSVRQTQERSEAYRAMMKKLGRVIPLHYQEPFRRGYGGWQPGAEDFVTDLSGARAGGAAGWCFHNGGQRGPGDGRPRRSFDLSEQRLFEQLDPEETKAMTLIAERSRPGNPRE